MARIISLNFNGQQCSLIIESSGLGMCDRITLDSVQMTEFKSLKNKLDKQEMRSQDSDLQDKIIKKFRSIEKLQKEGKGSVYAECQNSVDFG